MLYSLYSSQIISKIAALSSTSVELSLRIFYNSEIIIQVFTNMNTSHAKTQAAESRLERIQ